MKKARIISLALALALSVAVLSGCASAGAAGGDVTVTDMLGREVTLASPATEIVALSAADCEVLCALGADDALIGRGEYCNYPESVEALPVVASGSETNIEQIIALKPQLVLMSKMDQSLEQIDALESAGIAVAVSDADDIAGVYTAIEMTGALTGRGQEADALVAQMKDGLAEVAGEDSARGKSIYFEVSPLEYGLWTAGSGTFMDEIAAMLGLENVFADQSGWVEVSEEQVISRDPDFIVTITMYFGEGPTPVEEILARPGWGDVNAVGAAAVFQMDSDSISRPGPRLVDAARELRDFVAGA